MSSYQIFLIIFSALTGMFIGLIWYHPKIFGRIWISDANLSPENVSFGARNSIVSYVITFFVFILASSSISFIFSKIELFFWDGLAYSFFVWSGYALPILARKVIWDHQPIKVFLVHSGYWLVTLMVLTVILSY